MFNWFKEKNNNFKVNKDIVLLQDRINNLENGIIELTKCFELYQSSFEKLQVTLDTIVKTQDTTSKNISILFENFDTILHILASGELIDIEGDLLGGSGFGNSNDSGNDELN